LALKGRLTPFKITGGLGACPQTKLTISGADIRQFPAKGYPLANLATVENRQKSKIGELLILLFV